MRFLSWFCSLFPFLFGGAFIEASEKLEEAGVEDVHFPSFLEGLSLRLSPGAMLPVMLKDFPSFLEGLSLRHEHHLLVERAGHRFPFLFGGAFIEALGVKDCPMVPPAISLPFWRGFH